MPKIYNTVDRKNTALQFKERMPMIKTNVSLDVSGGGKAPIVHVKKGDTASRIIVFSLCSGSSPVTLDPSTDTATVNAALGGKSYIAACTVSDGRAILALPSSFTSEAGRSECELCICSADADKREVLYTPTFYLDIADNLDSSTAIEAEDRYTGLSALVTAGAQNAQKAENAAAAAQEAATLATQKVDSLPDVYSKSETRALIGERSACAGLFDRTSPVSSVENHDRITFWRDSVGREACITVESAAVFAARYISDHKSINAANVSFTPDGTSLVSTDASAAILELSEKVTALEARIAALENPGA